MEGATAAKTTQQRAACVNMVVLVSDVLSILSVVRQSKKLLKINIRINAEALSVRKCREA